MNKIIGLLSIIGIAAATYLSKLYYALHSGTAAFKSFCNLGASFNCDFVSSTRFATFLPGIPLSSLVIGWFLTLLILSLMAEFTSDTAEKKESTLRVGLYMSMIGSIYSFFLLIVMAVVLKTFCLFCIVIDFVNFGILFLFLLQLKPFLKDRPLFSMPQGMGKVFGILVGCLFFSIILTKSNFESEAVKLSDTDLEYMVNQITTTSPTNFTLPAGVAFLGNKDAKVTILELSDFQCPHCQKGALLLNSLLTLYPNDIKVGFLHFPLDSGCNRLMKGSMHPFACTLARGALCADQNKKFKEYYETIFENQDKLDLTSALNELVSIGLTKEAAQTCIDADSNKKIITDMIEFGITNKVESTPTFFFNGKKVEGVLPLEVWKKVIDKELQTK